MKRKLIKIYIKTKSIKAHKRNIIYMKKTGKLKYFFENKMGIIFTSRTLNP